MIFGTGIDIVKIARIKKIIDRWQNKFLKKVFTDKEIQYCQNKKDFARHFAVRFAAKEAAGKMFGTGIGKIKWTDIEVENDKLGKPFLNFSNEADEYIQKNGIKKVHLSLTHEDEYAVAQVIGEGGEK